MALPNFFNKINDQKHAVDYWDVRLENILETSISYKNGELLSCQEVPSMGAYLRVYHRGCWYEASSTQIEKLGETLASLVAQAQRGMAGTGRPLAKRPAKKHSFLFYKNNNASLVSLEEKLHFTQELLSIPKNQSLVTNWSVNYSDRYVQKWFLASDQVEFEQDYNQAGVRLGFTLKQGDQIFDDRASVWFMTPQNQLQFSQKIFSEAIKEATFFLSAETITPGKYSVLLSPEITGVFTHESFGHKSEADFMLGDEAMLKEWEMGKDVAAPWVSIVDEGHSALTSGYCPIDDEGNEKEKTYLIKNGKLAGRLHNAFTAAALGEKNTGNGRALNFEYPPMVRMTNTYIEAGDQSLQEVIRGVKKGLYIKDFKHGMGMSTFTIAPTKSYWIEDGKITKPVRISVISGSVFETLKNISAISNDFEIHSSAFGGCGKNDQSPLSVADGGPSILVDGMQVS